MGKNIELGGGGSGGASAFTDLTDKTTADLPAVNTPLSDALNTKENAENKKTDVDANKTSNTFFPTVKAVFDWVRGLFVIGAASSTDNAIARFDGTTGKLVQNSRVTIDDSGAMTLGGGGGGSTSMIKVDSWIPDTAKTLFVTATGDSTPILKLTPAGTSVVMPLLLLNDSPTSAVGSSAFGIGTGNITVPDTSFNWIFNIVSGTTSANSKPFGIMMSSVSKGRYSALTITPNGDFGFEVASPTAKVDINGNTIRLRTPRTPASSSAVGNNGDICWDANYVYVCVATNTWKRSALTTW